MPGILKYESQRNVKKHEGSIASIWFSEARNQMLVECETDMKQAMTATDWHDLAPCQVTLWRLLLPWQLGQLLLWSSETPLEEP